MKKVLILTSVLLLNGCFYQVANNIDIKKAVKFCGGVDKIEEIEVWFGGAEYIRCTNTETTTTSKVAL